MTILIDPIALKKLIIAKQLYQNAIIQSVSHNSIIVMRLLSVIGFDFAIETVLKTIIGSLDSSKPSADNFPELIKDCETLLGRAGCGTFPDKERIKFIHSIRNDAQHKAKYPNESDLSDCRTYARDFLRTIIDKLWGIDFEKISLTDVIQNEKVKQYLVDAETSLSQRNYQQAIKSASIGLEWTLNRVENAIVGHMPDYRSENLHSISYLGISTMSNSVEDGFRTLEKMRDTLLYVALGMNYSEFMQYKKLTEHVHIIFIPSGTPHYDYDQRNNDPEPSDVEFVVAYSINTVVQIESIVGSIDAPFGSVR